MKSGRIALTGRTKVMTKPEIMIPDELKQKAIDIVLPRSPVKKVGEIMTSPFKTIAAVQGFVNFLQKV